jgi:copper chaperone CopZ
MLQHPRIQTLAAALLFLILAVFPPPGPQPAAAAEYQEADLALEGMTCAACAVPVKAALQGVEGVRKVVVRYREKKATVVYDPDRVTPADLLCAVEKAGFAATLPQATAN